MTGRLPGVLRQCSLLVVLALPLPAQRSDRDSAFALWDKGMHAEAAVIFERLVSAGSSDPDVHIRFGFALFERAKTLPDAGARKQERVEARLQFGRALDLGSTSEQARALFNSIPPDGGPDAKYSDDPGVDSAMQVAERAFASHDMRGALQGYQHALVLDPDQYNAALFSGDAYKELNVLDSAYGCYGRATAINPARETAWRYWSGELLKHGKPDEAREKAVEAIIAEPYNRLSRVTLTDWARSTHTSIGTPRVALPVKDTSAAHPRYWLAYDSARKAAGTDTAGHRHTMPEERAALLAASQAAPDDPAVVNIKRMNDAGELEVFIFFYRADAGIAAEYAAYRAAHHDLLKRFWDDWMIGGTYSR